MKQIDSNFRRAVIEAAGTWDRLDESGDPNTIDLYAHARRVEELLRLEVPRDPPQKEAGVALVELVERHFIGPQLLRHEKPETIAQRAGILTDVIERVALLPHRSVPQRYVAALFGWHGCINMAKLLRRTYVTPAGEVEYKLEERAGGYRRLSDCWTAEVAR